MRVRTFAAIVAAAGLGLQGPAFAQLDMVTPQFNTQVFKNVLQSNDRAFGRGAGSPGRNGVAAGARPLFPQAGAAATARPATRGTTPTTYRASPAVSARVQKQFSEFMARQAGADGGRQVADAMRRTDPVRNWSQIVASDGLRPGDSADALAAYWVLNWVMANRGDNNRAQTLAVREQVRPMIAANPAYSSLNEGQRQEFSEVLMLNFLIQQAAYVDAMKRGDQRAQQQLGDAAVARFKNEMGVDLRTLTLTDRGLVQRR